jgi:hypothetical protein
MINLYSLVIEPKYPVTDYFIFWTGIHPDFTINKYVVTQKCMINLYSLVTEPKYPVTDCCFFWTGIHPNFRGRRTGLISTAILCIHISNNSLQGKNGLYYEEACFFKEFPTIIEISLSLYKFSTLKFISTASSSLEFYCLDMPTQQKHG